MTRLSVNINKIATLRNSRGGNIPDLTEYGKLILDCGAHGLTIHPRSDERHITRDDIPAVKSLLTEYNRTLVEKKEFNIEGEPSQRFLDIVLKALPDQVTLVPVSPGEITSDHGFNLQNDAPGLAPMIQKIRDAGMRVSIFVEAGVRDLEIAADMGVNRIELYTGPFAFAWDSSRAEAEKIYSAYVKTAEAALKAGLEINAGHDLDFDNLQLFGKLPGLQEVSIGHRLISWSLKEGLPATISRYLSVLAQAS